MIRILTICVLLVSIIITSSAIRAQGEGQHAETLVLQPELLALLQAEMREITTGVQKMPMAWYHGTKLRLFNLHPEQMPLPAQPF